MAKKLTLQNDLNSFLDDDYNVIAINCHLKDYRLIHFINKVLDFHFIKFDNLVKQFGKNFQLEIFSCFCFHQPEILSSFYILQNKNHSSSVLIQELKNIDYFLILKSSFYNETRLKNLLASLRKIEHIIMVQNIELTKIKNIQYLLSDIELLELEHKKIKSEAEKLRKIKLIKKK